MLAPGRPVRVVGVSVRLRPENSTSVNDKPTYESVLEFPTNEPAFALGWEGRETWERLKANLPVEEHFIHAGNEELC